MKNLFFLTFLVLIGCIFSCTENVGIETDDNEITTRAKPTKVTICHYNKGNETYKTRTINGKQLDKHLEHGDFIGACEDVVTCDPVCIFCDYIDLMDFDEPCPENPFNYGDNLCTHYTPDPNCPENTEYGTWEYTLWDRDKYRNEVEVCGTDDENDAGGLSVFWSRFCDGGFFGQVSVFYDENGDDIFEVDELDFGATEENYNRALYCKSILEGIATDLGLTDACEEVTPPCDPVCIFCDYIELMDFDEPCPENPFNYGDNLCTQYTPDPTCLEDTEYGTWEYTLWDRDRNRNENCGGTDDENDEGGVSVFWSRYCDGGFSGQVSAFYDADGDGDFEVDVFDNGPTEENYNRALYCKTILEGIAADLGLTDACN